MAVVRVSAPRKAEALEREVRQQETGIGERIAAARELADGRRTDPLARAVLELAEAIESLLSLRSGGR